MNTLNKNMGMYFLDEEYPLRKGYALSSIDECIKLRDLLNLAILKYSQEDIENENMLIANEIYSQSSRRIPEKKELPKGYVYLMLGSNGLYKIGYSKDPERRLKELCLSSCEKHELIHSFYCTNPHNKEQKLHKKYSSKRKHTEWFDLSLKDVEYIKGIDNEI